MGEYNLEISGKWAFRVREKNEEIRTNFKCFSVTPEFYHLSFQGKRHWLEFEIMLLLN